MLSFDEIALLSAPISYIKSRNDVNPFYFYGTKLPIFVSPMTCILDDKNFDLFNNSKVIPIRPVRYGNILIHDTNWQALTLDDFIKYFTVESDVILKKNNYHILIDCAHGAMERIFTSVKKAKELYPNITIMIGNISNPKTYLECCRSKIDYVRIGVGGGKGCLTSVLTGFHASLPWLITECKRFYWSSSIPFRTQIVADGGINTIDKAIKALALGADWVMMGMAFAKCKEACGRLADGQRVYYGQSSVLGQLDRFGKIKGHVEGCVVNIEPEYTIEEYSDKFEEVLRSAMSYANATNLSQFISEVSWEEQTIHEFNCYNK